MLDAGQPHAVGGEGQTDDQRGEEILEVLSIGLARVDFISSLRFPLSSSSVYVHIYTYIGYPCVYTHSLHIYTSTHIFYTYMSSPLSN